MEMMTLMHMNYLYSDVNYETFGEQAIVILFISPLYCFYARMNRNTERLNYIN